MKLVKIDYTKFYIWGFLALTFIKGIHSLLVISIASSSDAPLFVHLSTLMDTRQEIDN